VLIDPTNSGSWTECASTDLSVLPPDWLSKAFVGLTASTGQLADNHDVLSLQSFSDYEVMEHHEEAKKKEKAFSSGERDPVDVRLTK
jgi:lectin, mannose-binding 2